MNRTFKSGKALGLGSTLVVMAIAAAGFWQYRSAEAVSIDFSRDYVSLDAAVASVQPDPPLDAYAGSAVIEKSSHYYEIDYPGSGGKIGIGDSAGSTNFRPDLTISTWNGEAEFKLIAPAAIEGKSQLATSVVGDTVSASNGEWAFQYEPVEPKAGFNDKGGLDILITLKEKPGSNKLEFTFASSTVTPYYQPPLTEEFSVGKQPDGRIVSSVTATKVLDDQGRVMAERTEHAVNSIAFYANDRVNQEAGKTNYATGKVGHLYAMMVGDAWSGWTIDGDKLILTVPQDVLDKAQYPITMTPAGDTFGYSSVGASALGVDTDTWTGSLFTAPASGTGVSISVYCRNWQSSGTPQIKGVLADHNSLDKVTNGVTSALNTGNNVDYTWQTASFGTAPSITSADYVIGFIPYYYHDVAYDSGSTNQGHLDDQNSFSSPKNPSENPNGIAHSTRKLSIYVTYTASGSPSVSNSPSSKDFSVANPNDVISTGLNYFTVTNNSASTVTITIGGADITGGTTWTLSDNATPGTSTAGIKAGLNGGSYNIVVKKTAPYNTLKANLAVSGSQDWGLQLLAPSNYTDSVQKYGLVTLTATTP